MRNGILMLIAAAGLAGCTRQVGWEPTYTSYPTPLEQAQARCAFAVTTSSASIMNGGIVPSFVLREQCMAAEGWRPVYVRRNL